MMMLPPVPNHDAATRHQSELAEARRGAEPGLATAPRAERSALAPLA